MSGEVKRRPRRVLGAVIAAAFVVGGALAVPTAAQADGVNVVWSHGAAGTTALGVYGSSTTVNSVRVSHGDGGQLINYCGFQSKAWGTLASGSAYSSTFGYTSGCTPAPYYRLFGIKGVGGGRWLVRG